ncbi:MAG: NADH-quinone oxidoreductase subunit C [Bacteroidales bacterium]|nr:NADH-quinone oxidoreductase subunit C [Bacteroidales bacterium]
MTNDQLKQFIKNYTTEVEFVDNPYSLECIVNTVHFYNLARVLKESDSTAFDFLYCVTGIDLQDSLGVIYHLESTKLQHKLILKVFASDIDNPEIPSVFDLWDCAELQEREVFDFFGIRFLKHPDLRRIFMEEDWEGYPLRKNYVDTVNIIDLIK